MAHAEWKKTDYALRKGKLCQVTHIDFTLDPPAVTVKMLDANQEVGTEFSKLTKVPPPQWSCPICTFDNDMKDLQCTVCVQGQRTKEIYLECLKRFETKYAVFTANEKKGIEPSQWQCTMCTYLNAMHYDSCQMCVTARSQNAKLIYPTKEANSSNPQNEEMRQDENIKNNDNNNNKNDVSEQNNESEAKENNINEKDAKDAKDGKNGIDSNDSNSKLSNEINNNNNDSEWTLVEKSEIEDEIDKNNNENNDNSDNYQLKERSTSNTTNDSDPYLEVE